MYLVHFNSFFFHDQDITKAGIQSFRFFVVLSNWYTYLGCCGVGDHRHRIIEINQKSSSLSTPLKLMSSRMSPRTSHRRHQYSILASSSGSFHRQLFRTKRQQNVSFRNRQMSLKVSPSLIYI